MNGKNGNKNNGKNLTQEQLEKMDPVRMGGTLKRHRLLRRLSQVDVAERVGASQFSMSAYERGVHRPDGEMLRKILAELELSAGDFWAQTQYPSMLPNLPADYVQVGRPRARKGRINVRRSAESRPRRFPDWTPTATDLFGQNHTYTDIGKRVGVSGERVRQVLKRLLEEADKAST